MAMTEAEATAPKADGSETRVAGPPEPQKDAVVRVRGLSKQFRRSDGAVVAAVDGITLDVAPGEFVVLLGPSGCGKTTLLRCIAGLEKPGEGSIELQGATVFSSAAKINVRPNARKISMVFQSYALWPHMTALQNVAYPLRSRGVRQAEARSRVERVLELVGIPELLNQYPGAMSGGQQQRVALARAVVASDGLILFDEPLSNVDAKIREKLRGELLEMQRTLGFAAVYVTHDQTEAMELADRVVILNNGRIDQVGTPQEVYDQPRSRYVANFIGVANELSGTVVSSGADGTVSVDTRIGLVVGTPTSEAPASGESVVIAIRPERCSIAEDEPSSVNRWCGVVERSAFLGAHREDVVRLESASGDTTSLKIHRPGHHDQVRTEPGRQVWVSTDPAHTLVLRDAR